MIGRKHDLANFFKVLTMDLPSFMFAELGYGSTLLDLDSWRSCNLGVLSSGNELKAQRKTVFE